MRWLACVIKIQSSNNICWEHRSGNGVFFLMQVYGAIKHLFESLLIVLLSERRSGSFFRLSATSLSVGYNLQPTDCPLWATDVSVLSNSSLRRHNSADRSTHRPRPPLRKTIYHIRSFLTVAPLKLFWTTRLAPIGRFEKKDWKPRVQMNCLQNVSSWKWKRKTGNVKKFSLRMNEQATEVTGTIGGVFRYTNKSSSYL